MNSVHKFISQAVGICRLFFLTAMVPVLFISCNAKKGQAYQISHTLSVSDKSISIKINTSIQLLGVDSKPDHILKWSIEEGLQGGSVTSSGFYRAPSIPGTFHALVTCQQTGMSARIIIQVDGIGLFITPYKSSILCGQSIELAPVIIGNATPAVNWSISDTRGIISTLDNGNALYTAPMQPGYYSVRATLTQDPNVSTETEIYVTNAPLLVQIHAARIARVAWSLNNPGQYQLVRKTLDDSSNDVVMYNISALPNGSMLDGPLTPGKRYLYTILDELGLVISTQEFSTPIISITHSKIKINWPSPAPAGKILLFDKGRQLLEQYDNAENIEFDNLFSESFYFILFQDSSNGFAWIGMKTLPNRVVFYPNQQVYSPGSTLLLHAYNPFLNSKVTFKIERLVPRQETLIYLTANSFTQFTPHDGAIYGFDWPSAAEYVIPADAPSGMYSVSMLPEGGGDTFSQTFIVEPLSSNASRVLILNNVFNSAAYNWFGGVSFYNNQIEYPFMHKAPILGIPNPMPELTFQRPNVKTDSSISPLNFTTSAEILLYQWMEEKNFAFDLLGDNSLANISPYELKSRYDLIILNAHPEYWSINEENSLRKYQELGGNIISVASNTGYCLVELMDKPVRLARVDRGRDPYLVPVRSLLGTAYDHNAIVKFTNYEILHPEHWVFSNLPQTIWPKGTFGNGGPFGGGSGNEVDVIGWGSPKQVQLLAKGSSGSAPRADLVIFQTSSGATVINFSCMAFTSTLNSDPASDKILENSLKHLAPAVSH